MTIDNLISWLQEAEDNNTWSVSTQSVKRHLEKIKKTEQLTIPVVMDSLPTDIQIEGLAYDSYKDVRIHFPIDDEYCYTQGYIGGMSCLRDKLNRQ